MLDQVKRQPAVAAAEGAIFDEVAVFDAKGKSLGGSGSPSFVSSEAVDPRFRATVAKEGRLPRAPDEVAIDAHTADRKGVRARRRRSSSRARRAKAPFKVVGLHPDQGRGVLRRHDGRRRRSSRWRSGSWASPGGFDSIQAAAKPGTSADELSAQLKRALAARR